MNLKRMSYQHEGAVRDNVKQRCGFDQADGTHLARASAFTQSLIKKRLIEGRMHLRRFALTRFFCSELASNERSVEDVINDKKLVLQSGDHVFNSSTANQLNKNFGWNLSDNEWGKGLETAYLIPPDSHGEIRANGGVTVSMLVISHVV